eukprot:125638_1
MSELNSKSESSGDEYVPLAERRRRAQSRLNAAKSGLRHKRRKLAEEEDERSTHSGASKEDAAPEREKRSLVDVHSDFRKDNPDLEEQDDVAKMAQEEEDLLTTMNAGRIPLKSAKEVAEDVVYTESMTTSWKPPRHIRERSEPANQLIRDQWLISTDGERLPPPIKRFKDMRFPEPIMKALAAKNIKQPTPIQIQGLPSILSGRDMIGIAFTGSGKTLVFALPMVMFSLEAEMKLPLVNREGPVALTLCPSRELCAQTHSVVSHFCDFLVEAGYPRLRTLLCMGGINMRDQQDILSSGVHMVSATPGRLLDMLTKKKINFDICQYFCMDEADRLIDLGFDEDIRNIFSFFKRQRQTVMFSATMPPKIQEFAQTSLTNPVIVNVGRAGAANLDVIQEVEYVKQEAKIVYLLECLKKTSPPVVIFCSNQGDVDDVHEYLLLKGVECCAIHGGKAQEERAMGIQQFKNHTKDVLVATDVASKGLDFPDIQHVINYDMPKEIEDYVHRIGRTGRCGRTGVATTFINRDARETVLLDLKHLLREAKQKIPPVLLGIEDPSERYQQVEGIAGCAYCGGLGHRVTECPKLAGTNRGNLGNIDRIEMDGY